MIDKNLTSSVICGHRELARNRGGGALDPRGVAAGSLTFLVRRAWLNMRSAIAGELTEFGLTTSQYATLLMAEAQPGMSASDIAREVASSRQAANEMLIGLEQEGLIERRPNPSDRRSQQIFVTESGRAHLTDARKAVDRCEAELEAPFTPKERAAIREWLEGISRARH
ncbi:MarR family winged helix-turn-helix transcriptional regulator [Streptomyces sp. NPDC002669]|uniref:MarR family winged helix-turn-helix transcriptional regulator n=1 Tax=Streptomyces sp. NPDC002669 TaxID=3364658 RepID=UPI0036A0EBF6